MKVPIWMQAMRWYALHSPFKRGTYRLALWLYQHQSIPDLTVEASLDQNLWVSLQLRSWVDYNIYCLGLYEAPLARFFMQALEPNSVVLDIGAYIGQYTLLAAKYAARGRVIAFEPHPQSHQRLQANVTRNRLRNVVASSQAVGATPGQRAFRLAAQPAMSRLLQLDEPRNAVVEVELTSVDSIVRQADLSRVDLIKIDVEGAEGQVLRGAEETLLKYHPMLIMEVDRNREQALGDDPEPILRYLRDLGYALHALRRTRLVAITDLRVSYENVIAVPTVTQDRPVI